MSLSLEGATGGNLCFVSAGLTGLSGAATTFSTGATTLQYTNQGKLLTKAQVSGGATPTTDGVTGTIMTLVANQADDDGPVRAHAHDAGVPVAGAVPPNPAFVAACERGEPAWTLEPALGPAIRGVAATVWPLLTDEATAARAGGLRGSARRLTTLRRGSAR